MIILIFRLPKLPVCIVAFFTDELLLCFARQKVKWIRIQVVCASATISACRKAVDAECIAWSQRLSH